MNLSILEILFLYFFFSLSCFIQYLGVSLFQICASLIQFKSSKASAVKCCIMKPKIIVCIGLLKFQIEKEKGCKIK